MRIMRNQEHKRLACGWEMLNACFLFNKTSMGEFD